MAGGIKRPPKSWLKGETLKILTEEWNEMAADEQMECYEFLRAKVEKNRKEGWTSRL